MLYGIPLCMLIALRGHWGEPYPWHTRGGIVTEGVLRALNVPFEYARDPKEVGRQTREAYTFSQSGCHDRSHLAVGRGARTDSARRLGPAADRLEPARRRRVVHQRRRGRPAQPGVRRADIGDPRPRPGRARRRRRDGRHRCGSGRPVRPALSQPRDDAWRRQVRAREPVQSRSASGNGRDRDCGAAQDRQRQWQSASSDRHHAGRSRLTSRSRAQISLPLIMHNSSSLTPRC